MMKMPHVAGNLGLTPHLYRRLRPGLLLVPHGRLDEWQLTPVDDSASSAAGTSVEAAAVEPNSVTFSSAV